MRYRFFRTRWYLTLRPPKYIMLTCDNHTRAGSLDACLLLLMMRLLIGANHNTEPPGLSGASVS